MHETPEDLAAMQAVLDRSYASAGAHLLGIHTPERRLDAQGIADRLQDMVLLTLATVSRDGRPVTGPVDGFLYRGLLHFGSSPQSVRFRHIDARPSVSATHLPGEHLAVTVHGRAERIDVRDDAHAGFLATMRDFYGPRVGDAWEEMVQSGAAYARIHPERMFAFHMEDAG